VKSPRLQAIENLRKFLAKSEAGRFAPKEEPKPEQPKEDLSAEALDALQNLPSEG
jgi:hypothetical protein